MIAKEIRTQAPSIESRAFYRWATAPQPGLLRLRVCRSPAELPSSNPGSFDWESGVRPLSYLAPQPGLPRLRVGRSPAELPRSNPGSFDWESGVLPLSYLAPTRAPSIESPAFYRWATALQPGLLRLRVGRSPAELPHSNPGSFDWESGVLPLSYLASQPGLPRLRVGRSTAELPRSNPGSFDWESGVLPLSYLAPQPGLPRLTVGRSPAELPRSTTRAPSIESRAFYRWATALYD